MSKKYKVFDLNSYYVSTSVPTTLRLKNWEVEQKLNELGREGWKPLDLEEISGIFILEKEEGISNKMEFKIVDLTIVKLDALQRKLDELSQDCWEFWRLICLHIDSENHIPVLFLTRDKNPSI